MSGWDYDEFDRVEWDERVDAAQLHDESGFDVNEQVVDDVAPVDWFAVASDVERERHRGFVQAWRRRAA